MDIKCNDFWSPLGGSAAISLYPPTAQLIKIIIQETVHLNYYSTENLMNDIF